MLLLSQSILLITSTWPPHVGGAENYLFQIYRRLPNVELVVVTSQIRDDFTFDSGQIWRTIRVPREYFIAYWHGRRGRLNVLTQLGRIIRENNIDLVVTGFAFPDGLIAWMLKQVFRIPYIIHFYGLDFLAPMNYGPWERSKVVQIFQNADQLIGCSNYSRDKVIEVGVEPSKVHSVLPGVDSQRFHPVGLQERLFIRRKLALPEDAPILLTVSRLVPRKGHDSVLRSLPHLIREYPNLLYLIVGQGGHQETLQALVEENNLSDHVRFIGEITDSELPVIYQAADLFVMPNRDINGDVEGFGIVFIEASASGIPVIGGASGGTRDAIAEGISGFLVSPINTNEITDCVLRLLSNQALASEIGRNGRRLVEFEFSWERAAKQVAEIIKTSTQYRNGRGRSHFLTPMRAIREIIRPN